VATLRVDGGGGIDTLKLDGAGLTLDLTKISNTRIRDIEIIFHANTLLNPKCSFGISAGITMGINIISNIAFSSSMYLTPA
jgi:hypothetical protein